MKLKKKILLIPFFLLALIGFNIPKSTVYAAVASAGCYASADINSKQRSCPSAALDQYGNDLDTATTSTKCYVDSKQTSADGQNQVYNLVDCNNLSTKLANPTTANPKCESINSSMGWILCPVFSLFGGATTFLFKSILQPLLVESPVNINSSDPNNSSYKIWNSFRIIGNVVLLIAVIVIVYAEAVGGGIADAYEVRKMLPRILLAAIMINISIYIVAVMVDIVNVLGQGIGDLIMSPFKEYQALQFTGSQAGWGVLGFGLFALMGATGGIGLALLAFFATPLFGQVALVILLTVIIPLALGVLGVFITLVIRQGLILFLILISPVAFALYCLPNTEQYFKKWFSQLIKTLMVYPIIVLIFALSNILSITTLKANGIRQTDLTGGSASSISTTGMSGGVAIFIALLIQIIPLFLIPFAFKISGGMLGSVYSSVSGAVGKLGKFSRKAGSNQAKSVLHRAKTGDYGVSNRTLSFRDKTITGNQFRRRVTGLTTGPKGNFGFGVKGNEATTLQEGIAASEAMKNPKLQQLALSSDDGILAMHLSGGISLDRAKGRLQQLGWDETRINNALGAAGAVGVSQANAQAATTLMAQNKSRSIKGGPTARKLIMDSINDMSAGSTVARDAIAQNFTFYSRKSGRTDLGGYDTKSNTISSRAGWDKTSMSELAQNQDIAIQTHLEDAINDLNSSDMNERQAAAVRLVEMQNLLPNLGAGAQKVLNDGLDSMGWRGQERSTPLSQWLSQIRGIDQNDVITKARVYGSSVPNQVRSSGGGNPQPPANP